MATNTYVALDKVTVSTSTPSISFTSIPATYTDLVLVLNTSTSANSNLVFRLNNDSTSIYSNTVLNGNGTTASSSRNTNTDKGYFDSDAYSANNFNYNATLHVMNYSNTTTFKTTLSRSNNAATGVTAGVTLYRSTSAINRLDVLTTSGNFQSGSTFSLYGIASTTAQGAKAQGGMITSDDLYWYHTFRATDTFRPLQSISADVLVVAGGGGGGTNNLGGGGGAGGIIYFAGQSLTATNYTCTVGAGGATFANGVNSQFGSLTVGSGGGRGGKTNQGGDYLSSAGGSGGGGANEAQDQSSASNQSGTGATAFYGNAGGVKSSDQTAPGGGAGGRGSSGSPSGAVGGVGISNFSSWGLATGTGHEVSGTYWYGGGGASGANIADDGGTPVSARSNGGGGSGIEATKNGLANTGGGGGGRSYNVGTAGTGGSGIVIVRYAK